MQELRAPRIDTPHTHGTGCMTAAALAACLARGLPLLDAAHEAKRFITAAIAGGLAARRRQRPGESAGVAGSRAEDGDAKLPVVAETPSYLCISCCAFRRYAMATSPIRRDAAADQAELGGHRAAAQEVERLGFHSVWFNDHLYGIPMPQIPIMEAWTALSAVGAMTERVQLGTLVSPIGFRNPALLAKMVATLDNITDGRVIVGLGSGWFEKEFSGYGIDFPPVQDRLRQLDEGIELMQRMWSEEQLTFAGRHFHTDDVFCEPKPVRQPPILIGGGGEQVLLSSSPSTPTSGTTWR